jgi:hypothetical protein
MQQRFRSVRLVLRNAPNEREVRELASACNWELVADRPGDPDEGVLRELEWQADPAVQVAYTEDDMSPNAFVTVGGSDAVKTSAITAQVQEGLKFWSLRDLCRLVDIVKDPVKIGLAVLRLGLGSPYSYDSEVFQRITSALTHEDRRTRDMAIWATTYSPWPEYLPSLREVAENDPVSKLRERARFTVESYKRAGVMEP